MRSGSHSELLATRYRIATPASHRRHLTQRRSRAQRANSSMLLRYGAGCAGRPGCVAQRTLPKASWPHRLYPCSFAVMCAVSAQPAILHCHNRDPLHARRSLVRFHADCAKSHGFSMTTRPEAQVKIVRICCKEWSVPAVIALLHIRSKTE
ncbi:hypothetical protein BC835DRAFT_92284 [Cytidiella melzeri]|nr:hypothetical protein BC835DRAFT_92284 [Cytidiella melzeri]